MFIIESASNASIHRENLFSIDATCKFSPQQWATRFCSQFKWFIVWNALRRISTSSRIVWHSWQWHNTWTVKPEWGSSHHAEGGFLPSGSEQEMSSSVARWDSEPKTNILLRINHFESINSAKIMLQKAILLPACRDLKNRWNEKLSFGFFVYWTSLLGFCFVCLCFERHGKLIKKADKKTTRRGRSNVNSKTFN